MNQYIKLFFLLISAVYSCSFAAGKELDQKDADSAVSYLVSFIGRDIETKYTLMSDHYRSVFMDASNLEAIFDKESYEIYEIEDKKIYEGQRTGLTLAYIKVMLKWQFEGYDGVQTCHFKMIRNEKRWDVDWILC